MSPRISVVMANWRGERHLAAAIASVCRQTMPDWELIVSDDGSDDASVAIAQVAQDRDPRVRLLQSPRSTGPGAARNRALDQARGDWIAILDSDDLMHPNRLDRLLAAANRLQVGIIADDMAFFGECPGSGGKTLLQQLALTAPLEVTAQMWLRSGLNDPAFPALGYLKPMIRRDLLGSLRYDPTLRVGEDFDLVLRLLLAGADFAVLPDPLYLYRRHGASVSHRLSVAVVQAMIAAQDALPPVPSPVAQALKDRRKALIWLAGYEKLVAAIKARQAGAAIAMLARNPRLVVPLWHSLRERMARTSGSEAPSRASLSLVLAAPDAAVEGAETVVRVPLLAPPGLAWQGTPSAVAARLSALSERHILHPVPLDPGVSWALWLVPTAYDKG